MADSLVLRGGSLLRRVSFGVSSPPLQQRSIFEMSDPIPIPTSKSEPALESLNPDPAFLGSPSSTGTSPPEGSASPNLNAVTGSPRLSRTPSFSGSGSYQEDWEAFTPLDRLTVFDLLDNFALPQQLEKIQRNISAQTEKVKRQRDVRLSNEFRGIHVKGLPKLGGII